MLSQTNHEQELIPWALRALIFLLLCLAGAPHAESSCSLPVAENAISQAIIVIPSLNSPILTFSAAELKTHLEKMTGAVFPVLSESKLGAGSQDQTRLYIGAKYLDAVATENEKKSIGEEGFVIRTAGTSLFITGKTNRGALYGVYSFLEGLGIRWFLPGELGTVVPSQASLCIPETNQIQKPAFQLRALEGDLWGLRNRLNFFSDDSLPVRGMRMAPEERIHQPRMYIHSMDVWLPPDTYYAEHPEYYALVKQSRDPYRFIDPDTGKATWKVETSDINVASEVARNISSYLGTHQGIDFPVVAQMDGGNYSVSPESLALDEPDVVRWQKYSRRHYLFYKNIADELAKDTPGAKIMALAYHYYTLPPGNVDPAPKNMSILLTHYDEFDLAQPMNSPISSGNQLFVGALNGWEALVGKNLFIYEYYWKLNWLGLPWPIVHTISADIPFLSSRQYKGLISQSYLLENKWTLGLNFYVAAKLLWDPSLDPAVLREEWINGLFAEAAPQMKAYYMAMEAQMSSQTEISGNALLNAQKVFTSQVLGRMRRAYDQAVLAAHTPEVSQRLSSIGKSLAYTEKLMKFIRQKNSHPEYATNLLENLIAEFDNQPQDFEGVVSRYEFDNYLRPLLTQMKAALP